MFSQLQTHTGMNLYVLDARLIEKGKIQEELNIFKEI